MWAAQFRVSKAEEPEAYRFEGGIHPGRFSLGPAPPAIPSSPRDETEGSWDKGLFIAPRGFFLSSTTSWSFPIPDVPIGRRWKKMHVCGTKHRSRDAAPDGFASMDANERSGTLTHPAPMPSKGSPFCDLDAPDGELRVEAIDSNGELKAVSETVKVDSTKQLIQWRNEFPLASLVGNRSASGFTSRRPALLILVDAGFGRRQLRVSWRGGPGYSGVQDKP